MQWRGQATVLKAKAARWQTTINQKVAAKMFNITLNVIVNAYNVRVETGIRTEPRLPQGPYNVFFSINVMFSTI